MLRETWLWFYERTRSRDQSEASLADTLDVKASILLVVIVFIATLVPDVLKVPGLSTFLRVCQAATAVILGAGIVVLTMELWPRKYLFEDEQFLDELDAYLKESKDDLTEQEVIQMLQNACSEALYRVRRNYGLNNTKQRLLKVSAWLAIIGLLLQVLILFVLAIM